MRIISIALREPISVSLYIQCCLLCDMQLQYQYPTSFEFSEALLHVLFTNSYSSEYGTFVYDCQRERLANKVSDKTCSLW